MLYNYNKVNSELKIRNLMQNLYQLGNYDEQ